MKVHLGDDPSAVTCVTPLVNGSTIPNALTTINPASSIAEIEVNTAYLPNGPHEFSIQSHRGQSVGPLSQPLDLQIANQLSHPNWADGAAIGLEVNLQIPAALTDFTLWFFDDDYPTSYSPQAVNYHQGSSAGGNVAFSDTLDNLGIAAATAGSSIYTLLDVSANLVVYPPFPVTPAPVIRQLSRFPIAGRWAVAYSDDPVDFSYPEGELPSAENVINILDPLDTLGARWSHDNRVGAWIGSGLLQDPEFPTIGVTPGQNPNGLGGQTLPMRTGLYGMNANDRNLLLNILGASSDVVNFYGLGHGDTDRFLGIDASEYRSWIRKKRFRFAFVDGCDVGQSRMLAVFGADLRELATGGWMAEGFYDVTNPQNITKLRPAAFLGWKVRPPYAYPLTTTVTDPVTQKPCTYRTFETMCNFHTQLISLWENNNFELESSIAQAQTLAPTWLHSNPTTSGPTHRAWDLAAQVSTPGEVSYVTFTPQAFMRKAGFGKLRFQQYNTYFDWPSR